MKDTSEKLRKVGFFLLDLIEIHIPTLCLLGLFAVFAIQVFMRYLLGDPTNWAYEMEAFFFLWCLFLAAPHAQRTHTFVRFTMVYDLFNKKIRCVMRLIATCFLIYCFAKMLYPSYEWISWMAIKKSGVMHVPFNIIYAPYVVFVILTIAHLAIDLIRDILNLVKAFKNEDFTSPYGDDVVTAEVMERGAHLMPTWLIPVVVLVFTFIFALPMPLGIISSGVIYMIVCDIPIEQVATSLCNGMYNNYTILSVPMFVLMAQVMTHGSVADRLYDFCKAIVGDRKGALAYNNILVSTVFAGMSGSSVADASGVGSLEIIQMKKEGYDGAFSAALSSTTATVGPIIPPSIPMVIYAMLSGASLSALFLGGVVPGILISVFLAVYVYFVSKKRNYPKGIKTTVKNLVHYTVRAIPALMTIVILFAGIYGGVMTPTEGAAMAALWTVIVSLFIHRDVSFKELWSAIRTSALQIGRITVMTAASCVITWIVAREGIGVKLANFVLGMNANKYVVLFVINVLFLFLGMVVDAGVLQYVFIPLVLPIINALGINLIHFGVTIILNMQIGLSTPPFGTCLFITADVSGEPMQKVIREIIPMCLVMILLLFICVYVPQIVTFLPTVFGLM